MTFDLISFDFSELQPSSLFKSYMITDLLSGLGCAFICPQYVV